jgi:hypothetical protein
VHETAGRPRIGFADLSYESVDEYVATYEDDEASRDCGESSLDALAGVHDREPMVSGSS